MTASLVEACRGARRVVQARCNLELSTQSQREHTQSARGSTPLRYSVRRQRRPLFGPPKLFHYFGERDFGFCNKRDTWSVLRPWAATTRTTTWHVACRLSHPLVPMSLRLHKMAASWPAAPPAEGCTRLSTRTKAAALYGHSATPLQELSRHQL